MGIFIDISNKRFGRLTSISRIPSTSKWNCVCECGNKKIVNSGDLRSGDTKSCGCLAIEIHKKIKTTHGKSKSPEYAIWMTARNRCHNKNNKSFSRYGGRGIKMCRKWKKSFIEFFKHIGPRPTPNHSLDRIINSEGYKPGNVRWATPFEQGNNKRNNHLISWSNKTMTLAQWSRFLRMDYDVLEHRINHSKWSINKAFTQPNRLLKRAEFKT